MSRSSILVGVPPSTSRVLAVPGVSTDPAAVPPSTSPVLAVTVIFSDPAAFHVSMVPVSAFPVTCSVLTVALAAAFLGSPLRSLKKTWATMGYREGYRYIIDSY